ncbi:MAG: 30S ribosomal protein S20 [Thermodesulfovibrionales bacterium]
MPAKKKNLSVLKRARQAEKRHLRNKAVRTKLKTLSKKVEAAVSSKDKEQVQKALREAVRALDSAASKGFIHRNTASRNVARLTRHANPVLSSEAA